MQLKVENSRGTKLSCLDGGIGPDPKFTMKIADRTRGSRANETWRLRNFKFYVIAHPGERSINVNRDYH